MHPVIFFLLSVLLSLVPMTVSAGDIDSPGPPSAGSGVYTILDIYNYLIDGTEPVISSAFREPTAGPGPTMKSTKDIYDDTKAKFDSCDAAPDKVLEGVTFFRTDPANWGPRAGTMENRGAVIYTPTTTDQTVDAGYHNGSGKVQGDTDLISGNIASGIDIFGVSGSAVGATGDATVGDVLTGKTFSRSGAAGLTGTMTDVGQQNVTPGTAAVTITQGYHNGTGTVEGDTDLVAGNIKSGMSIFGVNGDPNVVDTTEGANPVAAERMKTGDVAFVNGNKVSGNGTKTLSFANDTVNAGYYEATTLSAVDADLVPGNIKNGVDIFGVTGRLVDGSNATRVPKTGQTGCCDASGTSIPCSGTGQDGEYQHGVSPVVAPSSGVYGSYTVYGWAGVRFTDNLDGTVTDNLTGLIWLKNANCFGHGNWSTALSDCNTLNSGECGLTDGSSAGDWRLPNINELHSLVDPTQSSPALPADHPFTGVQSFFYWSSTTYESYTDHAWFVYMDDGLVIGANKDSTALYVWPVRSGN